MDVCISSSVAGVVPCCVCSSLFFSLLDNNSTRVQLVFDIVGEPKLSLGKGKCTLVTVTGNFLLPVTHIVEKTLALHAEHPRLCGQKHAHYNLPACYVHDVQNKKLEKAAKVSCLAHAEVLAIFQVLFSADSSIASFSFSKLIDTVRHAVGQWLSINSYIKYTHIS